MTKVYELVYRPIDGYYHIACALQKTILLSMIEKVRGMDNFYSMQRQKQEQDLDYEINYILPSDFPLFRIKGFDEDEFFEEYDCRCADNFDILEHELILESYDV